MRPAGASRRGLERSLWGRHPHKRIRVAAADPSMICAQMRFTVLAFLDPGAGREDNASGRPHGGRSTPGGRGREFIRDATRTNRGSKA